jgi:hypothetical protein
MKKPVFMGATEAGIVRFNGIDFKTYTNKNTPFIGSERFRLMVRNNKGIIYAADEYENIFKVRQNELVLYRKTIKEINKHLPGLLWTPGIGYFQL